MKFQTRRNILMSAMLVIIPTLLFSFTPGKGGEGFEVFVGSRLVLQQFGKKMESPATIHLDQRFSDQQLIVKYYHCGQVGKERIIAVKDAQGKTLKEWKYPNISASGLAWPDTEMACGVKDILNLQKSAPGKLGLYYASSEIPAGRLLTNIIIDRQ